MLAIGKQGTEKEIEKPIYVKIKQWIWIHIRRFWNCLRNRKKMRLSNASSIFQPNAHGILNTYFIKSLLHVSVCCRPSSGGHRITFPKTSAFLGDSYDVLPEEGV